MSSSWQRLQAIVGHLLPPASTGARRTLLRASDPPQVLERLAAAIVAEAVAKPKPGSVAGAAIRWAVKRKVVEAGLQAPLQGLVDQLLRTHALIGQAGLEQWVRLDQAALVLHLASDRLRAQLRHPQWRRLYGWPRWEGDGQGWRFSLPAIHPATAAAFAAKLPGEEPWPSLPAGHLPWDRTVDMTTIPEIRD